jgi:hypothetical protein
LKWAITEYQDKLVIQLGGLHISMCFLKAIRNHMNLPGLVETWVESGLLGPNASEHAMSGKAYKRAICTHKIILQALLPSLLKFYQILPESLSRGIFYSIS